MKPFVHISLALAFLLLLIYFGIHWRRSYRKCGKVGCKGLKLTHEYDVLVQGKEFFKSSEYNDIVSAVDKLPWKTDIAGLPGYGRVLDALKRMAPRTGRAVLIYRSRCGCPISKVQSWGS